MADNPNNEASGSSKPANSQSTVEFCPTRIRLQSDLKALKRYGDEGITAFPDEDTFFTWTAIISGPPNTAYTGLHYKLRIDFTMSYPFLPPMVTFRTPCFHPNVHPSGLICLDTLLDQWSAKYDVRMILMSIQTLLAHANVDSPLNGRAAKLWVDQIEYTKVVRAQYAKYHSKD